MCLVNIAQAGRFAADRAIRGYANNIWNANPLPMAKQAAVEPVPAPAQTLAAAPASAKKPVPGKRK